MTLTDYTTLGRTGLRVSPLCMGAMTFGTEWGFGVDEKISRQMFDRYVGAGGNFIDTADGYTNGNSEMMIGKFVTEGKLRDRLAIATKFTFNGQPGNPNGGGNGRKNIYRALEGSLRRLQTDYVDLYYMHSWDVVTPVEEVLSTLTDLVRAGKIRYFGMSDVPAWYVARMQTLAEQEGKERIATLQLEYSLAERSIEREHVPAAQELGIGICPWGPLASGFLTGKYKREGNTGKGEGRLSGAAAFFNRYTEHNWRVLDAVLAAAKQLGKTPAQIALNWLATQPGVTSTILGATSVAQLDDNLGAIEFAIPADLRKTLDESSALEPVHPYNFFSPFFQGRVSGGTSLQPWKRAHVYPGAVAEKKATAAEK